ncbi:hypothetical protein [Pseudomonas lini]
MLLVERHGCTVGHVGWARLQGLRLMDTGTTIFEIGPVLLQTFAFFLLLDLHALNTHQIILRTMSPNRAGSPAQSFLTFSVISPKQSQVSQVDDSPRRDTSSNEETLQLLQPFRHKVCIIVADGFGTTIVQVQTPDQSGQSIGFSSLKFGKYRFPGSRVIGSYYQIWAIAHVTIPALSWSAKIGVLLLTWPSARAGLGRYRDFPMLLGLVAALRF